MVLVRKDPKPSDRFRRARSSSSTSEGNHFFRICRFEQMEPRRLLAADPLPIQIGAVYFEDGSGEDEVGDVFEITFLGGAPGTRLTELVIETDKFGDGLSLADAFFDTEPGGPGDFRSVGPSVLDRAGIDSVDLAVDDGGTTLVIRCTGFEAGEKLVFSIDVDERSARSSNSVVEGDEFEVSHLTATFVAAHYFDATGSDVFLDEYDGKLSGTGLDLPDDDYVPPSPYMPPGSEPGPIYTAGAIFAVEQPPLPISIAGTVFEDVDLDNSQQPGEPGLDGVELSLYRLDGTAYLPTGRATLTDAGGDYRFADVLPGVYQIVETQPDGYFSVGASAGTVDGSPRGIVGGVNLIAEIALAGGEDSVDNDFAEARPAAISGHVYHDADNDGVMDPGERGIGNVQIELQYLPPNGPLMPPIISTRTGADGSWSFDQLMPGDYQVAEMQPAGYFDGLDAAGTAGGVAHNPGDSIDGIHLISGQAGRQYDFGELMPASIGGRVHLDLNGNGLYDPGELLLDDVTVHLWDASGVIIDTAQTDPNGEYGFAGLRPGVYGVEEAQPAEYNDGGERVGSAGGTLLPPDSIVAVALGSGVAAVGYDFWELPLSSIRGRVHVDANGNGVYDRGETLLGGVTIELLDGSGKVIETEQTGADGEYALTDLFPGLYGVRETQPQGYFDGPDHVGSSAGRLVPPDSIVGIDLPPATDAVRYDFCEWEPASISGRVHVDQNANGRYDANEILLADVTVRLLDGSGNALGTTRTDAKGEYAFAGLAPGIYGVEEVQPAGYFDGSDRVGSAGGSLLPPDSIIDVDLAPGTDAVGYDFCEIPPASISGYVYVDDNDNGIFEKAEAGIAGVEIVLLDATGKPAGMTAVTDASGFYRFEGLKPGTYGAAETQPDGYFDGLDTAGSVGGAAHNPGDQITGAPLKPGIHATDYNFGELRPASIRGRVRGELDGDCVADPGEPLLAGVTIYLLDAAGHRIDATTTDSLGEYVFRNLRPGTYGVEEIQPEGYLQGRTHPGSAGGRVEVADRVVGAELGSGVDAVEYNFCELLPASISGYVFQDGPTIVVEQGQPTPDPAAVRDGQLTADDTAIRGVVLQLGDGSGAWLAGADGRPITAVTDARGYYEFTMLEPGLYTVLEVHPDAYVDGIDTPGTKGGIAVNPHENPDPFLLSQLAVDPQDDAILRIPINAGDVAVSYNFSELLVRQTPPIVPPPPDPPPFDPPPPAPPIPEEPHRMPFFPVPVPITMRLPLDGSGGPPSYTWHLSVIDAGRPRRRRAGDQVTFDQHDPYFDPVSWTGRDLGASQWIIANQAGVPTKTLWFGLPQGIPVAGDFNGDGYDEVGVFVDGRWLIDLNGNGIWDDDDFWALLGDEDDQPVVGDWDGDGKADIGIFGPAWLGDARAVMAEPGLPDARNARTGHYKNIPPEPEQAAVRLRKMKRSLQGRIRSDLIDHVFQYGAEGDRAVVGDFDGDGVASIGVFRDGTWFLDVDGNGRWSAGDEIVELGRGGDLPVVGDFTGDGVDDLGVYRQGTWHLDTNGNHRLDARDKVFELGGPHDKPVVGDFDGDGTDEIAVYQDHAPTPPQQAAK